MTTTTSRLLSRADGVTWRDTGRRIVALDPGTSDVRVLGGGAAAVWRMLDLPTSKAVIADRLGDPSTGADRQQVMTCLDDLVEIGLLREMP